MKKAGLVFVSTLIVSITLSACGNSAVAATPVSTNTPSPVSTFTSTPTNTPNPTNTPEIEPAIAFGEPQSVAAGGYSFRPPVGYKVDVQGAQVGFFDQTGAIIISIIGSTSNPQKRTADELLDEFTAAVFKKSDGEYKKVDPQSIKVNGVEGLSYDLTGTLFGATLQGKAVILMPNDDQYLYGLGIANIGREKGLWEKEGSRVFSGLIESITFSTDAQTQSSGGCKISTDSTYGYTQENPIKVGGDSFDGPARERAYLDNLLGANGERVSYERLGSLVFGDTILDAFEVTVAGKNVTLYIDEYSFSEPQAPVGFTCVGVFPLSQP